MSQVHQKGEKHLSLHMQSPQLDELEIIIGIYYDFRNILWVSAVTAKDAWCMRMQTEERRMGGRVSSHAVLFCQQSDHNQGMKSFADSGMGQDIMGKKEAA